jgi:hypothetical protein
MEVLSHLDKINFDTVVLSDPQPLHGSAGFYFTPLCIGADKKSICLQLPAGLTKQGVVSIKNGKYVDLMFERSAHPELIDWIERIEYKCQDIIDSKKELWFQTELTRDDIETMMTQVSRLYQSGKYILMRVFIDSKCAAYDENMLGVELDKIDTTTQLIPLVLFEGIKFSSRSFEISIKLIQVMVLGKSEKIKSSCLIKNPTALKASNKASDDANKAITKARKNRDMPVSLPLAKSLPVELPKPKALELPTKALELPTKALELPTKALELPKAKAVELPKPKALELPKAKAVELPTKALELPTKAVELPTKALELPTKAVELPTKALELPKALEEVTILCNDETTPINLRKPNEVYYEMYNKVKAKAKKYKFLALKAFLEAKQIKTNFLLDKFAVDDDDLHDFGEDDDDDENAEDEDEDLENAEDLENGE